MVDTSKDDRFYITDIDSDGQVQIRGAQGEWVVLTKLRPLPDPILGLRQAYDQVTQSSQGVVSWNRLSEWQNGAVLSALEKRFESF